MSLFSLIKKDKEYWLVDQVKAVGKSSDDYTQEFAKILEEWKSEQIGYLSLLMDEEHEEWLVNHRFQKISSIVEFTKSLDKTEETEQSIGVESLVESDLRDEQFAVLYDRCRSGSANKNNLFSIEQIMESLPNELGSDWRKHCFIFSQDAQLLGISIPHIEPGTIDEGRIFYFGVAPEHRGKGYGTIFHQRTLGLLKQIGANTYVGSTDGSNEYMIRIFEHNGCYLRDRKGIYRINI